jgi:hypothetical protein
VNLDPSLDEADLRLRQIAAQYGSVENRYCGAMFLIPRVNVWQLVALVIEEVQVNDDCVEHADRWHDDLETTSIQNHASTRGEVKRAVHTRRTQPQRRASRSILQRAPPRRRSRISPAH